MKILVIGLGSIGLRHARNLIAMGHEVKGQDLPISILPSGIKVRQIGEDDFDAVIIASPTPSHWELMHEAYEKGWHIFVEKPISDELLHLPDLLTRCEAKNRVVMTGYNLRFHSCVAQAEIWLQQDKIGKPIWASVVCGQFTKKPPYLADGVAINWSHEIDLALHLFGPGHVACASIRKTNGVEDIADIVIQHKSGIRSSVHLDYVSMPEVRATMIVGSKGRIMIDLVRRMAALETIDGSPRMESFVDSWDENYITEMQAFVDACNGKKLVGATGWDGYFALEIALQAREKTK